MFNLKTKHIVLFAVLLCAVLVLGISQDYESLLISNAPFYSVDHPSFDQDHDGVCDTEDIQAAIDYAQSLDNNAVVLFPTGTYNIETALSIADKSVTLDLNGSTLMQSANVGLITAYGTWQNVANVISHTTTTITIANTEDLLDTLDARSSERPVIKIVSDDLYTDGEAGDYRGEIARVASVDTGTGVITLEETLQDTYTTSPRVALISDAKVIIKNGILDTEDTASYIQTMIYLYGLNEPVVDNIEIKKNGHAGILVRGCNAAIIENCLIKNLVDNAGGGQYGYGVDDESSTATAVRNCRFVNCRHGYTTNFPEGSPAQNFGHYGPTRFARVINCEATACSLAGLDTHALSQDTTFENCRTYNNNNVGYQLRGSGDVVKNSSSQYDARGVDVGNTLASDREVTLENMTIISPAGSAFRNISGSGTTIINGGTFIDPGTANNVFFDLETGTVTKINGSYIKFWSSATGGRVFSFDGTATLYVDNTTVDLSSAAVTGQFSLIRIDSGELATMYSNGLRVIWGDLASQIYTNLIYNGSASESIFILDDMKFDDLPGAGIWYNGIDNGGHDSTTRINYTTNDNMGVSTLANDATPSVNGGSYFLTGGTTTITDFDDGVTGQIIEVIAAHQVVIDADSTNIILVGGTDWTMEVNDVLRLICKADNKWYELSRSDK